MAKFFVGQMVKVVRIHSGDAEGAEALGHAGPVNELDCISETYEVGCVGVTIQGDPTWCFLPEELEPILPSGHRASEFSFTELVNRCREGVSA